jgi:hypothetical protein
MRALRPRLAGLGVAIAVVLGGPWTAANADEWPDDDPAAGHGVVIASMAVNAAAGVGYRFTMKTAGEVDLYEFVGLTGAAKSDEGMSDGVAIWNVRTPASPMLWGYGNGQSPNSDFYLNGNGDTIVDTRGSSADWGVGDAIEMFQVPAGTYDVILWSATNARHMETRFRLHAPKGSKLVRRTVATRTFRLVQRQFSGTASVSAQPSLAGGTAMVNETANVAIRHKFFGAFALPSTLADTGGLGSYSGPTGTHQVQNDEMFVGAPAGAYSFTVDAGAGWEPLVAGADISPP